MLLGLLAVYIFYRSASLLFNNKNIGLIAAFIAAFYSPFLFQECNMERGAVIAYTNLLGFYFLLKAIRRHKVRYFFIAGLMIGISTAMRENVLAVFILAYILFVVKERYKFKIASIAAFLVGVVIIVSPFLIRNKIVGNTSSFERTGTEYFWLGNRDKLKMYCTQPYFMYNKSVK
jgi:4-amino-4-deoxy-L-arabinose transferase-like glycosyltransferase